MHRDSPAAFSPSWFRTFAIALGLCCITLAIFWPAVYSQFIHFDDTEYVTENPAVQGGVSWKGVRWTFTTFHAANWHPLTWLSHMMDFQLYGLRAWGHHLTSVVLHAANAALLFLALNKMTGARWRSAIVAALFAVHPLRVESVAWVSERKDVLSGFFFFLSLLAYAGYVQSPKSKAQNSSSAVPPGGTMEDKKFKIHPPSPRLRRTRSSETAGGVQGSGVRKGRARLCYCAALVLFAFGLMAKPMLVTLPFVLLLLDLWPLQRMRLAPARTEDTRDAKDSKIGHMPRGGSPLRIMPQAAFGQLVLEKVPFFLLSFVSSVVTFLAQSKGAAMIPLEHLSWDSRLWYAIVGYWSYVQKIVWPSNLIFLYLPQPLTAGQLTIAVIGLGTFTVLVIACRKVRPWLVMGWLWFLGMLVPVIGLIQVGNQAMADRYSYLPSIGFFIMVVWSVGSSARLKTRTIGAWSATAAALIACIFATSRQLKYWSGDAALYTHAIQCEPRNILAHVLLGDTLTREGQFERADALYAEALSIQPRYADSYVHRGYALAQAGKADRALTNYLTALNLNANLAGAHKNLGTLLAEQGKLNEAVEHFRQAVRLAPQEAMTHYDLGTALLEQRQFAEAAGYLVQALELNPRDLETQRNLGLALMGQGKAAEAIPHFEVVAQHQPERAQPHDLLAQALIMAGRKGEAIEHLRAAIRLAPDSAMALNNLAWILATDPQPALRNGLEAVSLGERACRLTNHRDPGFLGTLAAAYAEAGRFQDAISTADKTHDIAAAAGDAATAKTALERAALYRSGMPFHESQP